MLVDSHCHLDRLDLSPYGGDLAKVIAEANARGVERMLCVGIDMANAAEVMAIAKQYPGVYAAVGVHPMDVKGEQLSAADQAQLAQWAAEDCVIAVGETGLDYYYSSDSAESQQQSFKTHLALSKAVQKPVIVHTRDARADTLEIIREHGDSTVGGVLHCFTESWEMAEQALDLNYYISFSGIVTFNNAAELREVVKRVPLERILVETDSPYLAPIPYRGKKNVPQYVVEVAQCVAELKGVSFEQLCEITSANFQQLFKVK
ncbi:TatD family hydrolase [Dasania marina]|uniref:TatD family hydrolase n=1 Tax=Dasania marina TaxID=471499 RepID=UPI0030DB86A3|tara:strand:+ start:96652 stop:97434 length:783 start_codon:yes stop_codon:yes gene_type:complete